MARDRAAVSRSFGALLLAVVLAAGACGAPPERASARMPAADTTHAVMEFDPFVDTLAFRTFRFFWEQTDSATGLSPDRWPTQSFTSVASVGFALTAYPIGAERGWVTREQAADRALATLRFFWAAKQDSTRQGATGHHGFFYHFLDPKTGVRFENVELSTVDTALLFGGVLFCQSYFDGPAPEEAEIRALAESLVARADWRWASPRPPAVSHGWTPEEGHLQWDWIGYNEAMIVPILAMGSPSPKHALGPDAWDAWRRNYQWGGDAGEEHVGFPPIFGHQYSHVWIDFRGIQDAYMREKGIDYFENSRRATLWQRKYAIRNPHGFRGYGERLWGLTACDGPFEGTKTIDGKARAFHTYTARGATFFGGEDDGTIAPTGAIAALPFAPEIVEPMILALRDDHGAHAFREYGFIDALNPTLNVAVQTQHGKVVPGVGWYDDDYLGIDQGPILAMIENARSGLVWRTMRKNPTLVRGLRAAGFTGGWLDSLGAPAGAKVR